MAELKHIIKTEVLIIGAGAAGLQAARTLYDHGMKDFIVVEGRDELGGRMRSQRFGVGRHLVEIGPNWITGTEARMKEAGASPSYQLAQQAGLAMQDSKFDDIAAFSQWNTI